MGMIVVLRLIRDGVASKECWVCHMFSGVYNSI